MIQQINRKMPTMTEMEKNGREDLINRSSKTSPTQLEAMKGAVQLELFRSC